MVMIYGEGAFPHYRSALAAVGLASRVSGAAETAVQYEALLLPGGGDISGPLGVRETSVIRHFMSRGLPVLGICRGMQALNVCCGGTLYRRIPGHQQEGGDLLHATRTDGLMTALLGAESMVTSNHHQAIELVGKGLIPCQWTPDGTIEAVCHETLPVLGVQYHPERQSFAQLRSDAADGAPIFRWFARRCGV